jgi:hypothetical protein
MYVVTSTPSKVPYTIFKVCFWLLLFDILPCEFYRIVFFSMFFIVAIVFLDVYYPHPLHFLFSKSAYLFSYGIFISIIVFLGDSFEIFALQSIMLSLKIFSFSVSPLMLLNLIFQNQFDPNLCPFYLLSN